MFRVHRWCHSIFRLRRGRRSENKKCLVEIRECKATVTPRQVCVRTATTAVIWFYSVWKGCRGFAWKVEGRTKFPTPKWVRDVRPFWGLASFYWSLVPKFAPNSKPLNVMTGKINMLHGAQNTRTFSGVWMTGFYDTCVKLFWLQPTILTHNRRLKVQVWCHKCHNQILWIFRPNRKAQKKAPNNGLKDNIHAKARKKNLGWAHFHI